jgi:CRP-like cAMP-binding protein
MKENENCFEYLKQRIRSSVQIEDNDLDTVIAQFECRKIAKQDFLLKEGGRCDFWGFVHAGLLRFYTYTDTGEEYTNGFVREGGFITESMSFYTQALSLENIHALEDTTLVCINFTKLQKLYENFPAFDKFARILFEERLVGLKARILYRVQLDARSRYLHFVETQPELIKRVPLKYIASYLSITSSTLSRIRRKLLHSPY